MAVNTIHNDVRSAMCNAMVDAIDGGTGAGNMAFYTAAFAQLVVAFDFAATAFGAAANGVATCNNDPVLVGTVGPGADGTIAVGRVRDGDDKVLWQFACSTSGSDANLTNLTLAQDDTLTLTSFTVTVPAS